MVWKSVKVGEYELRFNEGRKWLKAPHLVGPCAPVDMMHEDHEWHMYPLSGEDFAVVYRTIASGRNTGLIIGTLNQISRRLQKETYIA